MKRIFISGYLLSAILVFYCIGYSQGKRVEGLAKHSISIQSAELENLRDIAQRTLKLKNPEIAAISLGQIAGLVWKLDEEYARDLFIISLNRLKVDVADSDKEIYLKNATYPKVISLIAKHDVSWAKQLINSFAEESGKKARTNLEIAENLLESDTKLASDFASQSIQTEITEGLIWFLKNLRQKNQGEANRLFLQILYRYPRQASSNARQFAVLGTYLFTSPNISSQDYQNISLTRVGNIIFPNISVNLPNIPANLVQEYIKGAISIINRPSDDNEDRQMKYALGYLLLPKAQEFAPDLVGELGGAMASLTSFVPPEIASKEAYSNINKKPGSPAERIEEIEKMADSYARDQLFLDVVFQAWRQNDFATAKTAAAKIQNKDVRNELETLISFGEATSLLKGKYPNLSEAMQKAERLPVSLEKSLLFLGAASVAEKTKQISVKSDALDSALKSARRLNDETTPFLILYISQQTADADAVQSFALLREAIKTFNKFENLKNPVLVHRVTIEPLTLTFPLTVADVSLNFQNSFQKAIKGNEDNAVQIIEDINDEQLKGSAFVALAKLIAAKKEKNISSAFQEDVVTVGEDGIRKSAVKIVMPIYPKQSLKNKISGVAVAGIRYDGEGNVSEIKILQSPDSFVFTIRLSILYEE